MQWSTVFALLLLPLANVASTDLGDRGVFESIRNGIDFSRLPDRPLPICRAHRTQDLHARKRILLSARNGLSKSSSIRLQFNRLRQAIPFEEGAEGLYQCRSLLAGKAIIIR